MKKHICMVTWPCLLIGILLSCSNIAKSPFGYSEGALLEPETPVTDDWFGSPCLSGDMLMVGSSVRPWTNRAGYVDYYEKDANGDWEHKQTLLSPEPANYGHFGTDIAIIGNFAYIGAWFNTNNSFPRVGKVYCFEKNNSGVWVNTGNDLYCPDPDAEDRFGVSIEINDGYAFIGALYDNDGSGERAGRVYWYDVTNNGGTLVLKDYIITPQPSAAWGYDAYDNFGADIGYDEGVLVISAFMDEGGGCAYIFEKQAGSWNCIQQITGSDTEDSDGFGEGLDIDNGVILSGAFLDDADTLNEVGTVYAFTKDASGAWTQKAMFRPETAEARDYFGTRISMDNGVAAIGTVYGDAQGTDNCGVVYFYSVSK